MGMNNEFNYRWEGAVQIRTCPYLNNWNMSAPSSGITSCSTASYILDRRLVRRRRRAKGVALSV
jgi:hypothetical protein